jgi:hypothetical protein
MGDLVRWTMLSELLEECFDLQEFSDARTDHWRQRISREIEARKIEAGALRYTGLAVDLLNLRPEICGSIVLDHELVKTICWEYEKLDGLQEIPLADLSPHCKRNAFVQSGVASLTLAAAGHGGRKP